MNTLRRWTYTVPATPGDSFSSVPRYISQPPKENQLVPAHGGCDPAGELGLHLLSAGFGLKPVP